MTRILILLISISLISACGGKSEVLVVRDNPTDKTLSSGEFLEFRIPADDSLSLFDIDIYARIHSEAEAVSIPSVLRIISPTGMKFSDTIILELNRDINSGLYTKSGIWKDFRWSYRRGVQFPVRGTWYVRLELKEMSPEVDGLAEVGFILKKRGT